MLLACALLLLVLFLQYWPLAPGPRSPDGGAGGAPPHRGPLRTDGIEEFEATLYRLAYLDFDTVVITFGG
jgi:hypothetical protein